MNKIAVDVVLLPSNELRSLATAENQRLVDNFGSKIVLGPDKCIPHISLAMGCLDLESLKTAEEIIKRVVEDSSKLDLTATNIYIPDDKEGFAGIEIEKTPEIQRIHETIIQELSGLISHDTDKEHFYPSHDFDERTPKWVNSYFSSDSFDKFFPHITTGYGVGYNKNTTLNFPIRFSPSALALCHLGSHATCRKILFENSF